MKKVSTSKTVIAKGPSGQVRKFASTRAAARALSGNGSEALRTTIARRCSKGGGYVKNTWVQYA